MTHGLNPGTPGSDMDAQSLRRRAESLAVAAIYEGLARVGRLHPKARPARHGLEVIEDVRYGPEDAAHHRLDVWRPRDVPPRTPAVLLVHGGGFRILSKRTHWMMALLFARAGYVVFTINYRLAPHHPFPAALEDTVTAYRWVLDEGERFRADPRALALAGESAGANLILGLTTAICFERPEPYSARAFEAGVVPRAILPACGLFQVTEPERFAQKRRLPFLVRDRILEICEGYLGALGDRPRPESALADPLLLLEGPSEPVRPLPPMYLCVGTRDPIGDDTLRLSKALSRRGVPHDLDVYPNEPHSFHALLWREAAQRCWANQLRFLAAHAPPAAGRAEPLSTVRL